MRIRPPPPSTAGGGYALVLFLFLFLSAAGAYGATDDLEDRDADARKDEYVVDGKAPQKKHPACNARYACDRGEYESATQFVYTAVSGCGNPRYGIKGHHGKARRLNI